MADDERDLLYALMKRGNITDAERKRLAEKLFPKRSKPGRKPTSEKSAFEIISARGPEQWGKKKGDPLHDADRRKILRSAACRYRIIRKDNPSQPASISMEIALAPYGVELTDAQKHELIDTLHGWIRKGKVRLLKDSELPRAGEKLVRYRSGLTGPYHRFAIKI